MLLYISGSFPNNQEGIASGAKVLLDSMVDVCGSDAILLLTTNTPIIAKYISENASTKYELLDNWKVSRNNIKKIYGLLDNYDITSIHIEYPGDLYGKTFLASFVPYLVKRYNKKHNKSIVCNVRLHEFSRARFLRKIAILPLLWFANLIYIPSQKDRNLTKKFGGNRIQPTTIGTNIKVISEEFYFSSRKKTISYFGSVYPGKGIEKLLSIWKRLIESDKHNKYEFKIIGDVGTEDFNHFSEYHKKVWKWIEQYGLKDKIIVTGYLSDEDASEEIRKSTVALLPYEDGLTLRRGSFIACLSHGIPIVTSLGDDDSNELFEGHKGISMSDSEEEFVNAVKCYAEMPKEELIEIHTDNKLLSNHFNWNQIASNFLKDYKII